MLGYEIELNFLKSHLKFLVKLFMFYGSSKSEKSDADLASGFFAKSV